MPVPLTRKQVVLLVILATAVIPYFVGLGNSSLWDANEAFYAETPREMLESGDYINPSFNFQPRFNKPVLPYWTVAVFYHVFDVSERTERLPIAMGALVLVATAFGLGRLLGSLNAGLLAAIVLATAPSFLMFARRIIIDVHVSMFAGLTLLCFALAEASPDRRRRYLVLMYLSIGLGTLTKGPIAILLPGLVFLIHLTLERRLADVRRMMLPTGVLIVAVVVLPWYVLVYQQHGWVYIESFVVGENLVRYTQTVGAQSRGPFFYLPVMLGFVFPWSLFLPFALWAAARRTLVGRRLGTDEPGWSVQRDREGDTEAGSQRTVRVLVLWVVAFVLFFSLSSTKQDLYILPIVPAAAALIGGLLARGLDSAFPETDRRLEWITLATGLALLLVGAAFVGLLVVAATPPLGGLPTASAVIVFAGLAATGLAVKKRLFAAIATLSVSFAVVSWCFVLVTLPDFERYKPVRPLVDMIESRASTDAVIGYYKFALPSMVFYLQRPVLELFDPGQVSEAFASNTDVYFLMTEADYLAIRGALPVRTYVVDRRPLLDVKLMNFLDGTALQQVLLVSNRSQSRSR